MTKAKLRNITVLGQISDRITDIFTTLSHNRWRSLHPKTYAKLGLQAIRLAHDCVPADLWPPLVRKDLLNSRHRYPARTVGWREGSSPSRSRQTGREPLDSSGLLLAAALCWLISIAGLASPSQPVRLGPLLGSHYKTFIANTPQSAPVRGI